MGKLLIIVGGDGLANAVAQELSRAKGNFVVVTSYVNRPLAPGERGKISVSKSAAESLATNPGFVAATGCDGSRQVVSMALVRQLVSEGRWPVMDWPLEHAPALELEFGHDLFVADLGPSAPLSGRPALSGKAFVHAVAAKLSADSVALVADEIASLYASVIATPVER